MFKKRALQVKVVKTNDAASEHAEPFDFEEEARIIADSVHKSIKTAVLGVCGYVVLDTLRQVIVNKASR